MNAIEGLMEQLRAVARQDGVITPNEHALLAAAGVALRRVDDALQARRRAPHDLGALIELRAARRAALEQCLRCAFLDGVVTLDERELLITAMELLAELR